MEEIKYRFKDYMLNLNLQETFNAEINYRSGKTELNEVCDVSVIIGDDKEPVVISIAYPDEGVGVPQVFNSSDDTIVFTENGSILIEGENTAHGRYVVTISPSDQK